MQRGEPIWEYWIVQERFRSRAGVMKAFEADGFGCCVADELDAEEVSLIPNICRVSRRAEREIRKWG